MGKSGRTPGSGASVSGQTSYKNWQDHICSQGKIRSTSCKENHKVVKYHRIITLECCEIGDNNNNIPLGPEMLPFDGIFSAVRIRRERISAQNQNKKQSMDTMENKTVTEPKGTGEKTQDPGSPHRKLVPQTGHSYFVQNRICCAYPQGSHVG